MKQDFRSFQNYLKSKPSLILVLFLFAFTYWLYSQTCDPCYNINGLQEDEPKLVACLSNNYLKVPSVQPYNLTNLRIDSNPTQYGQNLLTLQLLQNKRNGFYIECLALDGELFSNTLYLERNFGWKGLLIEAEVGNYNKLMSKHRKSWTSNSCVSLRKTAEKISLVGIEYGASAGGLSPVKNSTTLKNFPGYVNSKRAPQEVQCFPLYTYLLALGVSEVDYFSLDVEGGDLEVLKTIPFDKVIFKVLEVEAGWVKEGKPAVRTFLESHGYIFVKEVNVDYMFIHNSVKLPNDFVVGV